ncbi:hypothetical protein CMEL01_10430 [Colletotrichum melonis]|uniref:Transmembrane protein n=1 Tax=Colletotrichum melonis TaxID=1209925 RepID=A0AAI9TUW3_9PEZI|nr:hypothetical protein CMEL01_10430 [Colletotrichum melonis]
MTTNVCPFNVSCEGPSNWESNSDITGSGVLIGFVGTAYIVFFLILVHYFVAYNPEDPPPRRNIPTARLVRSTAQRALVGTGNATNTSFGSTYWVPNPIDVRFLEWIRLTTKYLLETCRITLPSVGKSRSKRVQLGFNKAILKLCDVQLITGTSILAGGFICLDNALLANHWQVIVYLAWFSCVTHLSGLTVLRRYLQNESWARYIRLALMLVLLLVLVVAVTPTAFFNWATGEKKESEEGLDSWTPAICFFHLKCALHLYHDMRAQTGVPPFTQTPAFVEMLMSQSFIVVGFVVRTFKLSTRLSEALHRTVFVPLNRLFRQYLQQLEVSLNGQSYVASEAAAESARHGLVMRPVLAAVLLFRTQVDLFNSMLGEIFWVWVILLWGTSKLTIAILNERWDANEKGDDSQTTQWQFGQVLPVLLLAAPLTTFFGPLVSKTDPIDCRVHDTHEPTASHHNLSPAHNTNDSSEESLNSIAMPSSSTIETSPERQQPTAGIIDDEGSTERVDDQPRMSLAYVVSEGQIYEVQWMLPYFFSSLLVVGIHFVFLFRYATEIYLCLYLYIHGLSYRDPVWLYPYWSPMDYMFNEGGVFYLTVLSYFFTGHATILVGLTVSDWTRRPTGTLCYCFRFGLFWLLSTLLHGLYASFTYQFTYRDDSDFVSRIQLVIFVTVGFYGLYVMACLFVRYRSRRKGRAGVDSRSGMEACETML